MSRGKSGALKAAVRPKSDAGTAGFRAWRDLPAAVAVEMPPIEAEAREIATPTEAPDPKRRMTQPGLFDALGVKV